MYRNCTYEFLVTAVIRLNSRISYETIQQFLLQKKTSLFLRSWPVCKIKLILLLKRYHKLLYVSIYLCLLNAWYISIMHFVFPLVFSYIISQHYTNFSCRH